MLNPLTRKFVFWDPWCHYTRWTKIELGVRVRLMQDFMFQDSSRYLTSGWQTHNSWQDILAKHTEIFFRYMFYLVQWAIIIHALHNFCFWQTFKQLNVHISIPQWHAFHVTLEMSFIICKSKSNCKLIKSQPFQRPWPETRA